MAVERVKGYRRKTKGGKTVTVKASTRVTKRTKKAKIENVDPKRGPTPEQKARHAAEMFGPNSPQAKKARSALDTPGDKVRRGAVNNPKKKPDTSPKFTQDPNEFTVRVDGQTKTVRLQKGATAKDAMDFAREHYKGSKFEVVKESQSPMETVRAMRGRGELSDKASQKASKAIARQRGKKKPGSGLTQAPVKKGVSPRGEEGRSRQMRATRVRITDETGKVVEDYEVKIPRGTMIGDAMKVIAKKKGVKPNQVGLSTTKKQAESRKKRQARKSSSKSSGGKKLSDNPRQVARRARRAAAKKK